MKGGTILKVGSKADRVFRASCDDCRYVGGPQREKMSARVDLELHRRTKHRAGPMDPRDEVL